MARLAPVLHAGDLPLAELCAARLDGELFGVDEAFLPIDVATGAIARAKAAGRFWPGRLIAERATAAWIWGATVDPPARHQLCTSKDARARPPVPARSTVREVTIAPDEYARVAALRVTTPLRTVVDLARFGAEYTDADREITLTLARLDGLTLTDCREALDRRRNLPAKKLAWSRLLTVFG
ncbi:type IV toxin-antitoxin system AbiEi family antitoxin [Conyzicola sp.]|uniref:type IV toxin-antitoxin system AbiEi family antitoxin n=1 Tax=Conyzicola sp. TaxID=1969404 RepID=UPI00398A1F79